MSSIAAGTNPERTNRWLLIGAVVLAILAGILVFAALANFGSDDGTPAAVSEGDVEVLVATQNISPNTVVTETMFETRTVASTEMLVPGAISDDTLVVGQVARAEILRNQQLSSHQFAVSDTVPGTFSITIPAGKVAESVGITEVTGVAGFPVPGDRVDLIGVFIERRGDEEYLRIEPVVQAVEVLAYSQVALEPIPPTSAEDGAEAPAAAGDGSVEGGFSRAPGEVEPNPRAGTATVALTLEEAIAVAAAQESGKIYLALRRPGERDLFPLGPVYLGPFGFVAPDQLPPP